MTACALAGMCLGGGFGYAAGVLAPGLFESVLLFKTMEPRGVATVFGGFGGVLLGGGLGCLAVLIDLATRWMASRGR